MILCGGTVRDRQCSRNKMTDVTHSQERDHGWNHMTVTECQLSTCVFLHTEYTWVRRLETEKWNNYTTHERTPSVIWEHNTTLGRTTSVAWEHNTSLGSTISVTWDQSTTLGRTTSVTWVGSEHNPWADYLCGLGSDPAWVVKGCGECTVERWHCLNQNMLLTSLHSITVNPIRMFSGRRSYFCCNQATHVHR